MKFRHFRNQKNNPVATLATEELSEKTVLVALSRCNTGCDTFHKKYGREIAQRRIETGRHMTQFGAATENCVKHLLLGFPVTLPKTEIPSLVSQLKETFTTPKRAAQLACS